MKEHDKMDVISKKSSETGNKFNLTRNDRMKGGDLKIHIDHSPYFIRNTGFKYNIIFK